MISLVHPKAINIGHDEVWGFNQSRIKNWLSLGERMLPAELFLQDVTRVHNYLKQRGVATWMWGDMLISPAEFPNMNAVGLDGLVDGYSKDLRSRLPKDIVICDWHYFPDKEYPSLDAFQHDGFRVIAATWENEEAIGSFTKYAKTHNAYGVMDTIWYNTKIEPFKGKASRIISVSQKAFYDGAD